MRARDKYYSYFFILALPKREKRLRIEKKII